eukprot:1157111-Pelagomonas_calceolata.AAC.4
MANRCSCSTTKGSQQMLLIMARQGAQLKRGAKQLLTDDGCQRGYTGCDPTCGSALPVLTKSLRSSLTLQDP